MEAKADLMDSQPAEPSEREIDKLFRAAIRLKGSDLHLRVDGQPAVRLRGSLRALNRGPISDEEMERLCFPLLDNRNRRIFEETGGADFAESVAIRGEHSHYEPGDVLVVDRAAGRRLMLSRHAYSTRVAGIYSTKPGVLATTHSIDDSDALAEEIPLAIVGIVPCKVTAENGPIAPGDLLVTSSTPGYAMKGRNRTRMLGAVVGKALEPLREGKGVIQVLVTLQ